MTNNSDLDMDEDKVDEDKRARLHSISKVLTNARRQAKALPEFPGELPSTFLEAYEVQRISRNAWHDEVAGWKVGGVPPAFRSRFDAERLVGPAFAACVQQAEEGRASLMPVFERGFAAIEPEFIIQIGASRAEDRMFIGVEIASSPIPAINDVGPIAVICDFGNNNGLLLGPEIIDWQTRAPEVVKVETLIDGEVIGAKELDDFRKGALAAYQFLLDHVATHGIALTPGTFVLTGAITGVHEASIGAKSHLDFGLFGSIDLQLVKAEPID